MLNLASSKLSSTGRVARKKWLFISAHGLQAMNHGHGTFQAGILLARQTLRTITALIQQFLSKTRMLIQREANP
jgi:hypothetical protein